MRSHDFKLFLCAGLAVLCGASPASAQSAAEIVATPRVSGLSPSPDGKLATFVRAVNVFDAAARPSDDDTSGGWRAEAQLWLLDLARGDARPLTAGKARPSAATWSPDARAVAFVRKVEGGPAIHVLPLAGGGGDRVVQGAGALGSALVTRWGELLLRRRGRAERGRARSRVEIGRRLALRGTVAYDARVAAAARGR